MKNPRDFFLEMIENGQFRITSDGHAILFGEFVILTPAGAFLKLHELLSKEMGKSKAWRIIQALGEFQMAAAIKRYKKRFNIQQASSLKILDFMMEILNILGWGFGTLIVDPKRKIAKIVMHNSMLPQKYKLAYKKNSTGPIDYFILGWMKALFEAYFGCNVKAKETKCIAKGDPFCEFVVKASRCPKA